MGDGVMVMSMSEHATADNYALERGRAAEDQEIKAKKKKKKKRLMCDEIT